MTGLDIRIKPEDLRSINTATFTGAYQAVSAPLAQPSRLIHFTNNSNTDVTISWDGVTDHDFIPKGSFLLLDVASDRQLTSELYIQAGTRFYVKGAAGVGSFYIASYYGY